MTEAQYKLAKDQEREKAVKADKKRMREFVGELCASYGEVLHSDVIVLQKMKELWHYMLPMFEGSDKYGKEIRKSKTLTEYKAVANALFAACDIKEGAGYQP